MERRINKKIENYMSEFKENVKKKASELGKDLVLVQYIYDYERLVLVKEDFMKRKRVKNIVNLSDRCCAKRANGEQCTRRRKDLNVEFCGTHLKGRPHGKCDFEKDEKSEGQKVEVWQLDLKQQIESNQVIMLLYSDGNLPSFAITCALCVIFLGSNPVIPLSIF